MMQHFLQRIQIILLAAALTACSADGVDIGPTIADLGEQPPLLNPAEAEPQATFEHRSLFLFFSAKLLLLAQA